MNETEIKKQICDHLTEYRINKLHIADMGEFTDANRNTTLHGWILPQSEKNYEKNLILDIYSNEVKEEYLKLLPENSDDKKNHRHTYFHHLNSSQAMALNFFIPLTLNKDVFSKVLFNENAGYNLSTIFDLINKSYFEFLESDEILGIKNFPFHKTNFDFVQECTDRKLYFEVKYTESAFEGKNKKTIDDHDKKLPDQDKNNYKFKWDAWYKKQLEDIGVFLSGYSDFYSNYQIWRNISYSKYGDVIFTFPSFRKKLQTQLDACLKLMTDAKYKDKIHILYSDRVCEYLMKESTDTKLKQHYTLFWEKYFEGIGK